MLTISKGDQVFFGGNDDYVHRDSYYWIDPGEGEDYGAIWIGRPENVQQGVNERGLAYDANGLPRVEVNPHSERVAVPGGYTDYPIHILRQCATVEQVVTWVETHEWHSYMHDQMHFADATGDAVVISAGADGEVAFTRKPAGDGFLVSTNFNLANPANGFGYPCWRYARARENLARLLDGERALTAQDVAGVLEAVHQDGVSSWTVESLVADLTRGRVHLYFFYQFGRPLTLDVREEIADPRAPGPLSALFPEEVREEAARRYAAIQAQSRRCRSLGAAWLVLVLVSSIVLLPSVLRRGRGSRFWIPALVLLGPIALLTWWLAGPHRSTAIERSALLEAVGGVMPTVVAGVTFILLLIGVPALQRGWPAQLALLLGLPLFLGWLVFQGALLAPTIPQEPGRFLVRRLPQALIAANLGLAGMMIAMPLANVSLRFCPVQPISAWAVATWWAIFALGALIGVALLFLYERWAKGRGFQAWSVLAAGEGTSRTPPWRRLWWWMLLSYAVLAGGLAASAVLQQLLNR